MELAAEDKLGVEVAVAEVAQTRNRAGGAIRQPVEVNSDLGPMAGRARPASTPATVGVVVASRWKNACQPPTAKANPMAVARPQRSTAGRTEKAGAAPAEAAGWLRRTARMMPAWSVGGSAEASGPAGCLNFRSSSSAD